MSRPFIEEGLERLADVRYLIWRKNDVDWNTPPEKQYTIITDTVAPEGFIASWADLLSSKDYDELSRFTYNIRIPRLSIVSFILEVIEEVSELHRGGTIHGDIKPSNTLVNRNGKALIDEVGLAVGDVSPTITVGWSPYEQLLRQPLSCAADVFPLGLLLLSVLGGQPLGREVSCRMPGGEISVVVEDPTIYMEDSSRVPSAEIRKSWCRFIEKTLRTDHRKRIPSAAAMAGELHALVDREGIEGDVSITLPWGDKPCLTYAEDGTMTAGWVMEYAELTRLW